MDFTRKLKNKGKTYITSFVNYIQYTISYILCVHKYGIYNHCYLNKFGDS